MAEEIKLYFGSTYYNVPMSSAYLKHTMTDTWVANAKTQYNAMKSVISEISVDGIPFFISTDQHGGGLQGHRWLAGFDPTIKSINLGDNFSSFSVENAQSIVEQIGGLPNIISVPGNHEFMATGDESCYEIINNAYTADGLRRFNRYCYYSVIDDSHNVKWLAIQPYVIDATDGSGFVNRFKTEQAKWLIKELSADDGYDIILLNHQPFNGSFVGRNGETTNNSNPPLNSLTNVLKDRVSGGSGTYTDSDGVVHNYDFSNTDTKLLGMLHGHLHKEVWRTENGFPEYCADGQLNNKSCVFGVFDRLNNKLRIWKFDNSAVYDELTLDIGVITST